MKAKEIQELIDFISNSGLAEVDIETDQFKLSVKRNSGTVAAAPAPLPAPAAAPAPADAPAQKPAEPKADDEGKYLTIKSPMIGTFYRAPGPDKEDFVKVGDKVAAGQPVCIVEAMKLFNEIESEVSGTIVKVLVDDASPVEYDQPLFLVDPS